MLNKDLELQIKQAIRCCKANSCEIDNIESDLSELEIIVADHEDRLIVLESGSIIISLIPVENYSALPDPTTVAGQFYFVKNSQGSTWIPGWLPGGGTYYPAGVYYSDGISWFFNVDPWQADQDEVDAGIVANEFVTPFTLANTTSVSHPGHTHVLADITDFGASGVLSISKSGDPLLTGDVTLSEGSNITLTQVGNNIEISSTGGGPSVDNSIIMAIALG